MKSILPKNCHFQWKINIAIFKNVLPKICHKLGKHLPYFLSSVWQSCRDLHVRDRNRHLRCENIWLKPFKDRQRHYSDFVVILFITRQPRESRWSVKKDMIRCGFSCSFFSKKQLIRQTSVSVTGHEDDPVTLLGRVKKFQCHFQFSKRQWVIFVYSWKQWRIQTRRL